MKFRNPGVPGFCPDPSIGRASPDYWPVTSSFEFFPGVPVFDSRELVHWGPIGHCLRRDSQLLLSGAPSSGGIYAPTPRYHQAWFCMVTTTVHGGGLHVVRL